MTLYNSLAYKDKEGNIAYINALSLADINKLNRLISVASLALSGAVLPYESKPYRSGSLAIYNDKLYQCVQATTGEEDPSDESYWQGLSGSKVDPATNTKLGGIIVGDNLSITEEGVLSADINDLQSAASLALSGSVLPYEPGKSYLPGSLAIYDGKLYQCVQATLGEVNPTDSNYWSLVATDSGHATNTSYGVVKLAVATDTEADYAVDAAVLTSAVGGSTEHFGGSAVASGTLTERFNSFGNSLLSSAIKNGAYGVVTAMTGNSVDLSKGSVFTKTSTGAFTLSVTNTANYACVFTLVLTNGGVGTVTWPTNTRWAEGTPPDLQKSGIDVLSFLSVNNGATWFGVLTCTNAA